MNNNGELGRITSTNYGAGNYQHEICEWFIHVRPGRTVRVTFNDMNIYAPPSGGGCSTDSLVVSLPSSSKFQRLSCIIPCKSRSGLCVF